MNAPRKSCCELLHALPSVTQSVGMYQRGSHWTDLREKLYCGLTRKLLRKIEIWLKSGKNTGHCTWRPKYVLLLLTRSVLHKCVFFLEHPVCLYCQCYVCQPNANNAFYLFPSSWWLLGRVTVLCYTYIAYFFFFQRVVPLLYIRQSAWRLTCSKSFRGNSGRVT